MSRRRIGRKSIGRARLTVLSATEAQRQDREVEERGRWAPPTLEAAAAIDQAAAMVDRFNRLFMRTLRSLRDLRRYTASVVVQNVGQLNLGRAQVNITKAEAPSETGDGGRVGAAPEMMVNQGHED